MILMIEEMYKFIPCNRCCDQYNRNRTRPGMRKDSHEINVGSITCIYKKVEVGNSWGCISSATILSFLQKDKDLKCIKHYIFTSDVHKKWIA